MKALITGAGLSDVVDLTGPMAFEEVKGLLRQTDIFALACVTEKDGGKDNLPTVIMEAMAAGLPCVSTRLAGIPEMVEEGATGLLVPEGDAAAFAGALGKLLGSPQLRLKMGREGAALARERFAKEKTAFDLLNVLVSRGLVLPDRELLNQHPSLAAAYRRQSLMRVLRATFGTGRRRKTAAVPDEVKLKRSQVSQGRN